MESGVLPLRYNTKGAPRMLRGGHNFRYADDSAGARQSGIPPWSLGMTPSSGAAYLESAAAPFAEAHDFGGAIVEEGLWRATLIRAAISPKVDTVGPWTRPGLKGGAVTRKRDVEAARIFALCARGHVVARRYPTRLVLAGRGYGWSMKADNAPRGASGPAEITDACVFTIANAVTVIVSSRNGHYARSGPPSGVK